MPIKYALYPYHLTTAPNDYRAVVKGQKNYRIEDVIDEMISRGSTVTKAEALSVLEEYELAITNILKNGGSISTGLMNISASISGVFAGELSSFDPSQNYVRVNINPGERISGVFQGVEVQKVDADERGPEPELFKDLVSETVSETLTPGGIGELSGNLLKVDTADTNQGIFFIGSDGTETHVTSVARNKPSKLIFMIPDTLTSGEYHIEVRTKLPNVTDVRVGRLGKSLMVP